MAPDRRTIDGFASALNAQNPGMKMPLQHLQLEPVEGEQSFSEPGAARFAARESLDFFLRTLDLLSDYFGHDILTSVIVAAIQSANVAHLSRRADPGVLQLDAKGPLADDMRTPISIGALSRSLNLPFETVRRHVLKLIESGWCTRTPKGVIVRSERLTTQDNVNYLARNTANLQRLLQNLSQIDSYAGRSIKIRDPHATSVGRD